MATNKVQDGLVIQHTCGAAESYSSGNVVCVGGLLGIAIADIAALGTGSVALTGAWTVSKHYNATPANGTIFSAGDPVFWDITNSRACKIPGYPLLGYAIAAATGDATTVNVLLAGQREVIPVYAGEAITAGQLLYMSSINVNNYIPTVALADCDASTPANAAVLVAIAGISSGALGLAGKAYVLTAQNTSSASSAGDPVYLSDTAGGWTLTAPSTGGDTVQQVGRVVVKDAAVGVVYLNVDLGRAVTVNTTS